MRKGIYIRFTLADGDYFKIKDCCSILYVGIKSHGQLDKDDHVIARFI